MKVGSVDRIGMLVKRNKVQVQLVVFLYRLSQLHMQTGFGATSPSLELSFREKKVMRL